MVSLETVEFSHDGASAEIALDRPEKKNSISPRLIDDLTEALDRLADQGISVLVLTGNGDAFCSGFDLEKYFKEQREKGADQFAITQQRATTMLKRLHEFSAITVAKVNGWAVGGGVLLQSLCDLAVASKDAQFCLSEINFGMFPAGGASWALASKMNPRPALYYLVTGEQFSAETALDYDLINDVTEPDELDDAVAELRDNLAEKDPLALLFTKQVFKRIERMSFEEARDFELAKSEQLDYFQEGEWVGEGIGQFSTGAYKPGRGESYDRE